MVLGPGTSVPKEHIKHTSEYKTIYFSGIFSYDSLKHPSLLNKPSVCGSSVGSSVTGSSGVGATVGAAVGCGFGGRGRGLHL